VDSGEFRGFALSGDASFPTTRWSVVTAAAASECVRAEIAQTVVSEEELKAETRHLFFQPRLSGP
jgi:hypothetical protein